MNWKARERASGIFFEALEREPSERHEFAVRECEGDTDLLKSILKLLKHVEEPHPLFERNPFVAETTDEQQGSDSGVEDGLETIELPSRIGRYPIIDELGRGGMGLVYLAADLELKRQVAIKVLPPEWAHDSQHLQRFEREAQALAALNHPNIATIYSREQEGHRRFLTMEAVEGETLDRLLGDGPLPVPRAREIARQIARALEAAHERGIIHRDLKPQNVMVAPGDRVKVLDFGLARQTTPLPRDASSPTVPLSATGRSQLLGTPGYMSPEQARGEPVDARSDIWSFGCMFFECLSGKRALPGNTTAERLQAAVDGRVNWHDLPRGTPRGVVRLLRQCLETDPYRRPASMAEVEQALDREGRRHVASRQFRRLATVGLPVALIALGAVWMIGRERPEAVPPEPSFHSLEPIAGVAKPELSPRGILFAHLGRTDAGTGLFVRSTAAGDTVRTIELASIDVAEGTRPPTLRWSPDGTQIAFSAGTVDGGGGTFTVATSGGPSREIGPRTQAMAWSPDGTGVAVIDDAGREVLLCPVVGGEVQTLPLRPSDGRLTGLDWTPEHDLLLLEIEELSPALRRYSWNCRSRIELTSPDGQRQGTALATSWQVRNSRFSPDGRAIYFTRLGDREITLMRVQIDPVTLERQGEPVAVLPGPDRLTTGAAISLGARNDRVLYTIGTESVSLWQLPMDGDGVGPGDVVQLTEGPHADVYPRISPDGREVAFVRYETQSRSDVYVVPVDGGTPRRVTDLDAPCHSPAWSPDGGTIVFACNVGGPQRVWRVPSAGGDPEVYEQAGLNARQVRPEARTFLSLAQVQNLAWSPASRIAFQGNSVNRLRLVDPTRLQQGWGEAFTGARGFSAVCQPQPSPRSSDVAVHLTYRPLDGSRPASLWIISPSDTTSRRVQDGSIWPIGWSADGEWIYARVGESDEDGTIARYRAADGESERVLELPFPRCRNVTISSDESILVCSVPEPAAEPWMIRDFDPTADAPPIP